MQNPNTSNNTELNGQITCAGLITGSVRLAKNGFPADLNKTDIIVISSFHPEDTGKLMTVGGIIVEEGGITSHISIIARELGIPCLINVKNATKQLKENQKITLDANCGNIIK